MTLEAISRISVANRMVPPAFSEVGSTDEQAPQREAVFPLYLSPVFRYDQQARVAILAFRDGNTGDTTMQYPPEQAVREYRRNGGEDKSTVTAKTEDASGSKPGTVTTVPHQGGRQGSTGQSGSPSPTVATPLKV